MTAEPALPGAARELSFVACSAVKLAVTEDSPKALVAQGLALVVSGMPFKIFTQALYRQPAAAPPAKGPKTGIQAYHHSEPTRGFLGMGRRKWAMRGPRSRAGLPAKPVGPMQRIMVPMMPPIRTGCKMLEYKPKAGWYRYWPLYEHSSSSSSREKQQ